MSSLARKELEGTFTKIYNLIIENNLEIKDLHVNAMSIKNLTVKEQAEFQGLCRIFAMNGQVLIEQFLLVGGDLNLFLGNVNCNNGTVTANTIIKNTAAWFAPNALNFKFMIEHELTIPAGTIGGVLIGLNGMGARTVMLDYWFQGNPTSGNNGIDMKINNQDDAFYSYNIRQDDSGISSAQNASSAQLINVNTSAGTVTGSGRLIMNTFPPEFLNFSYIYNNHYQSKKLGPGNKVHVYQCSGMYDQTNVNSPIDNVGQLGFSATNTNHDGWILYLRFFGLR